jgi:ABC-type Na+ efflux pump permease subunit
MIKIFVLAWLEVKCFLRDKGDLAFSLLLPVAVFALMFGAFSGQSMFHGTAYIVNQDTGGAYSKLLLDRLAARQDVEIIPLSDYEAEKRLLLSDIQLVTYIPENFSASLARGWPARIIFRQRGNGGQEGQIVGSLVRSVAGEVSQEAQVKRQVQTVTGGSQEHVDTTVQKFLEREKEHPFIAVVEETVGSRPDTVSQFLPGIITMFVLFAITISSRTIVEERERGTLERLMTTRLTAGQLFIGKFLAGTFRGFIQTALLLSLGYAVFRIFTPISFLTALLVAVLYAMAASALGLLIGSLSRTVSQANWMAVVYTMATTMLGGTFFIITKGTVLYYLSLASLNTYANEAYKSLIIRSGSLIDILLPLYVLASVTIVSLILSRVFFQIFGRGGREG